MNDNNRTEINMSNLISEVYISEYPMKTMIKSWIICFIVGLFFLGFIIIFNSAIEDALILWILCLVLSILFIGLSVASPILYFKRRDKLLNSEFFIVKAKLISKNIEDSYNLCVPVFENFNDKLQHPFYSSYKDFDNITEGNECYIFLPPELNLTVLGTFSYYYPIAILDSTVYSISPIFDKNFISIEDDINNHLVK